MTDSNNSISRRQALAGIVSAGAAAAASRPVQAQTWGRVFIFNTAPDVVQLELNRRALPAIVGTEREDYYIPDVISVDRTTMLPDLVVGEFAARNKLQVRYPDGAATYQIDVDAAKYELKRDLLLYVHRDGLIMLHDGTNISEHVQQIS